MNQAERIILETPLFEQQEEFEPGSSVMVFYISIRECSLMQGILM